MAEYRVRRRDPRWDSRYAWQYLIVGPTGFKQWIGMGAVSVWMNWGSSRWPATQAMEFVAQVDQVQWIVEVVPCG